MRISGCKIKLGVLAALATVLAFPALAIADSFDDNSFDRLGRPPAENGYMDGTTRTLLDSENEMAAMGREINRSMASADSELSFARQGYEAYARQTQLAQPQANPIDYAAIENQYAQAGFGAGAIGNTGGGWRYGIPMGYYLRHSSGYGPSGGPTNGGMGGTSSPSSTACTFSSGRISSFSCSGSSGSHSGGRSGGGHH